MNNLLVILFVIFPMVCYSFTPSESFIKYVKSVENFTGIGYKNGYYYPVPSVEGGLPTIGYGCKFTHKGQYDRLSEQEAHDELVDELDDAAARCRCEVPRFDDLDTSRQEMLVDFAFNIGTTKTFPKFTKAIISNDIHTMKKEYIRYAIIGGKRVRLARNKIFYARYLENRD